jgi:hypothetical protein
MLGPNDIDDWVIDEGDRLRAEIRLLPVVLWFRRDPKPAAAHLGKDLAARLRGFARNSDMPLGYLGALLDDLRRAGATVR